MKKQPVVYVEREILKRGQGQSYFTYGFIVSKAYLKSKTENYLDDGQVKANYEVEYIGYDDVNENIEGGNFAVSVGYFVPKARIYNNYEDCQASTKKLTEMLFARRIATMKEDDKVYAAEDYHVVKNLISTLENNYLLSEENSNKSE